MTLRRHFLSHQFFYLFLDYVKILAGVENIDEIFTDV